MKAIKIANAAGNMETLLCDCGYAVDWSCEGDRTDGEIAFRCPNGTCEGTNYIPIGSFGKNSNGKRKSFKRNYR